jgi:hypothetical protein
VSDRTESHSKHVRLISVHELSQFVFCLRSGALAYESETEDEGFEGRPINLGYLPQYSLISIEAYISRAVVVLCVLVVLGVISLVVAGVAALAGDLRVLCIAQMFLGAILVVSLVDVAVLIVLLRRRRRALRTPGREPLFLGDGAYPVHWWELRAAGFSPRRFKDVLQDEELGIKGRPWAILLRGTRCIPVLRMNGDNDGVYPNHMVRIAGYCHLIEAVTNYESPYGIALLPRRLDAMAVPNTSSLKSTLRAKVKTARSVIDLLPDSPDEPEKKTICLNCPLARPRRFIFGKSDTVYFGQKLRPCGVEANGSTWHTTCGDRFGWRPPTLVGPGPSATTGS